MAANGHSGQALKISDADLRETVENLLRAQPDLEGANLEVVVARGWVTLRGAVEAFWKKRLAEDTLGGLSDLRGVTNELVVVPSRTYEDELIADRIEAALARDIHGDAGIIDVRVDGGRVTLAGTVPDLRAFRTAQTIAETTPGVVAVDNDLEIR